MKHRTQVLLEAHQYQLLARRAQAEGRTVSSLIRRLVERELGETVPDLSSIMGIASGPGRSARDHDEELYG